MNTPEIAMVAALTLAAAIAAVIALPRPKPEPPVEKQPPVEVVIESQDLRPDTQRAAPLTTAQRVDKLGDKLDDIEKSVSDLKELVRQKVAADKREAPVE